MVRVKQIKMLTTGPYSYNIYIVYTVLFTYFFKSEILDRIKEPIQKENVSSYRLLLFFKNGIDILQKIHTLNYILLILT